jgi:hypothetical protein
MRGTLLYPKVLSIWWQWHFRNVIVIGSAISVVFLEIRSEHIDIDAASFGIIECSEAGILQSWHFHFVPVDNSWIQDFTICWESFIAHLRHDPLQHWTVLVAMSAFQFHKTVEWLFPIYSIDLLVYHVFVDSFKLAKSPRKHMAAFPYWNSLHSAFCRKWLVQLTQCDIQRMTLHLWYSISSLCESISSCVA